MLAGLRPSMLTERLSLYWRFFDPSYLFVSGGFTRLTSTTRHVALFPLAFLVLVPLGLIQMVTARRTPASMVVFLGFALAPVAACLTVLEPYASDRELALLLFSVLIAAMGRSVTRSPHAGSMPPLSACSRCCRSTSCSLNSTISATITGGRVLVRLESSRRLEAIIARKQATTGRVLSSGDDPAAGVWRFAVLKHHREDLQASTRYVDGRTVNISAVPAHAGLILMNRNDTSSRTDRVWTTAELDDPEPGDPPFYILAER
jgi:hypothetical protein